MGEFKSTENAELPPPDETTKWSRVWQEVIPDRSRRKILAAGLAKIGLGVIAGTTLNACRGSSSNEHEKEETEEDNSSSDQNNVQAIDGMACRRRGCRPTPVPGPSPTTPPPSTTPGPAPAPVPGGIRTFSFLGLNSASLGISMAARQTLADGSTLPVWSFGGGFNNDRAVPAPVIELVEGQAAAISLSTMMPHSIHPHGLDVDQANDGVPATSGFVGMAMPMMGNFGRVAGLPSLGSSYTYRFTAPHAGTYMYHCHVDTVLHQEMGMVGTIIVRPPDGNAGFAWEGGPQFTREYIWQLHTFDTSWHSQRISGAGTVRYRPNVFMINGRNGNLATTDTTIAISGVPGDVVLLRLVNAGYLPAVVSLGGLMFQVIASDGRPLREIITTDQWQIAAGERYDLLLLLTAGTARTATVDYYDIRGSRILGSVSTLIQVSGP